MSIASPQTITSWAARMGLDPVIVEQFVKEEENKEMTKNE